MKFQSLFAALLAFGLLAAACGDDDASTSSDGEMSAELQAYADALAGSLLDEDDLPLSEAEVQCAAEGSVQAFGLERLEAFGTPEELASNTADDLGELEPTDEEIDGVLDAFFGCADIIDLVIGTITEGGELTEEQTSCVEGVLDEDRVRELFALSLTGGEPDDSFFEDLIACQ